MSSDAITQTKRPSVLGGAMIIAGTAVGAGMFSIPVMTAGVWFTGSVLLLIYTWFCMYTSGLMILEANLNYPSGSSFHTITKDLLGNGWSVINGLSIAFVLYILTYAYISAGGSMLQENLAARGLNITPAMSGIFFAAVVAVIVWISTKAVDHQRLTAAVKNNARTQLAQAAHPGGEPRRIHTFRQTAADHHHIELPEPGQRIGHKLLPLAFGDTETGKIQIRHRAAVFGQFHVDPGAPRDHMEAVCQPVLTEKMLKFFLIILPQKAADSHIHPEVAQNFGDINAFSRRM